MNIKSLNPPEQNTQVLQQRLLRCYRRRVGEPSDSITLWLEHTASQKGNNFSIQTLTQHYLLSEIEVQRLLNCQFLQTIDGQNYQLHSVVRDEVWAAANEGYWGWKMALIGSAALSLSLGVWALTRPISAATPNTSLALQQSWQYHAVTPSVEKALSVRQQLQQNIQQSGVNAPETINNLIQQYTAKQDKTPLESWLALAFLYELKGKDFADKVVEAYSYALKADVSLLAAYNGRAQAHRLLGNTEAALDDYNSALKLDPANEVAFLGKADIYAAMGEPERAMHEFNRLLLANPNNEWAYKQRAHLFMTQKDYAKAIDDFSQALHINPYATELWEARAEVYTIAEQYPLALADCNRILQIQPQSAKAKEQKKMLEKLLQQNPNPTASVIPSHKTTETTAFTPPKQLSFPVIKEELPTVELGSKQPISGTKEPLGFVDPAQPINSAQAELLQKVHPELHRFIWLLGNWQVEGNSQQTEEWRLTGFQQLRGFSANQNEEDCFSLEYLPESGRVLLRWQWNADSKGQNYELLQADAQTISFQQSESPAFPNKIVFQRRSSGGYSIFIQNRSEFSKKQQQWLSSHYQLMHNREAIRKVQPAPKGRL